MGLMAATTAVEDRQRRFGRAAGDEAQAMATSQIFYLILASLKLASIIGLGTAVAVDEPLGDAVAVSRQSSWLWPN